jgi:DNA adenine methylase
VCANTQPAAKPREIGPRDPAEDLATSAEAWSFWRYQDGKAIAMDAKPIVPWPGGKRRLLRHLLPLLSDNPHTTYVEAFAGGAALLFAREPARVEVLNDLNGDLVRLYRVVANHLDEFVRQFRWALASREMFRWAQLQHIDTLTDIQRAARFYYLQRLAFGGKVAGRTFGVSVSGGPRINVLRLEEDLSAAHLRLARVTIEQLPWQACLARYDRPSTLFFLDPPYWQTEGYGTEFGIEQYEQLAQAMAGLKGQAILTINDHPDMRRIFGAFPSQLVSIAYTVGGGHNAAARKERIYRAG